MSALTPHSNPTHRFVLLVHGHPWESVRDFFPAGTNQTIDEWFRKRAEMRLAEFTEEHPAEFEQKELAKSSSNALMATYGIGVIAVAFTIAGQFLIGIIILAVAAAFGLASYNLHQKRLEMQDRFLYSVIQNNTLDYKFSGGFHSTELGDFIGSFLSLLDPAEELRPFRDTSLRAATELWQSLERVRPKLIKIRESLSGFPKPETIQLEIDELTAELQRESDPVVKEIRQQSIQSKRDQLGIIQQLAKNEKRMAAHHEMVSQKIDTLRSILVANQAEHYLDSPILTRTEEITRGMLEDLHRSEQAIQSSLEEVLTLGRE